MKLLATPKSHFSRKIRLLLDHLKLPYELVDVGDVSSPDSSLFDGNPAMGVPVLEDGDIWMVESDHIASYLVRTYDPHDRFDVLTDSVELLNLRAVMNNIMANEVKLILAERGGLDPGPHAYFQKALKSIELGLSWLEARSSLLKSENPGYAEFHFICLWEHLELYQLTELNYPKLRETAVQLAQLPTVRKSTPLGLTK